MFTSKRKRDDVVIFIDGHGIDEVTNIIFFMNLGIHIDNELTWKNIINYRKGKISRVIGIVSHARSLLNSFALRTLDYAFVYPYLSHSNHVWVSVKPAVTTKTCG